MQSTNQSGYRNWKSPSGLVNVFLAEACLSCDGDRRDAAAIPNASTRVMTALDFSIVAFPTDSTSKSSSIPIHQRRCELS